MVVALGLGYVGHYRSYVRSLRGYDVATRDGFAEQDFPLLTRHQVTQLGMAHRPGFQPESSYTLVERRKTPGTVRIGIFGCSFVMGSEASPGQDFPSHLQRLFDEDGDREVEVVNFGVGAFGVQQSYLLWLYLAAVLVESSDDRNVQLYSFRARSKDSILDVSGGSDARFIALAGAIPGDRAWLRFSVDGSPTEIELGGISFVRGRHVGVLDRSWSATDGPGWTLQTVPHRRDALALEVRSDHEITDLRVEIGGVVLLEGLLSPGRDPRTRRVSWVSARGDLITTRGHSEQDATAIAACDGGELCITGTTADRSIERWCTRRWRLNRTAVEIDRPTRYSPGP